MISVIIPVYNRAALIGGAIDSVLNQKLRDFELLVVDDGSTDDLHSVLGRYADPRISVIRHESNSGAAAARNTGVNAARGDYVAFLDSDDCWDREKLERQLAFVRTDPQHRRVCCTGFRLHRRGERRVIVRVPERKWFEYGDFADGCSLSPGSTMIVERSLFAEVGLLDEDLGRLEDWDWLLRASLVSPVAVLHEVLADVMNFSFPDYISVRQAVEVIRNRHLATMEKRGKLYGRRFRAVMRIELAAAAFHQQEYAKAARQMIASLAIYPGGGGNFIRRICRGVGGHVRFRVAGVD